MATLAELSEKRAALPAPGDGASERTSSAATPPPPGTTPPSPPSPASATAQETLPAAPRTAIAAPVPAVLAPAASRISEAATAGALAASSGPREIHNATAPAGHSSSPFSESLKESDHYWACKVGIRVFILVLDFIAIGCVAWLIAYEGLSIYISRFPYASSFEDRRVAPALLGFLIASFVWCTVELAVRFLRRPPRPVHPGLTVSMDLVLWLGLLAVLLFMVSATINVSEFGSNPRYLGDPSFSRNYDGYYTLDTASDTWVYNVTKVYYSGRDNPKNARRAKDCQPLFATCVQQDAYINGMWKIKPTRVAIDTTTCVAEALITVGHFALFVWACVDTNLRRRARSARAMATRIIQDMARRGEITLNVLTPGSGAVPVPVAINPTIGYPIPTGKDSCYWQAPYGPNASPMVPLAQPLYGGPPPVAAGPVRYA